MKAKVQPRKAVKATAKKKATKKIVGLKELERIFIKAEKKKLDFSYLQS